MIEFSRDTREAGGGGEGEGPRPLSSLPSLPPRSLSLFLVSSLLRCSCHLLGVDSSEIISPVNSSLLVMRALK